MRLPLILCLLLKVSAWGVEIVGSEALIPLPKRAEWSKWVYFAPPDGEVVTLNPPIFSWPYNPTLAERSTTTNLPYAFLFQCSYNSGFTSTAVNVQTKCNYYNLLAPFSAPVFWRVGYINLGDGTNVFAWSDTRTFTISGSATQWDRSFLADTNYIAGIGHPRFLFDSNGLVRIKANLTHTNISRSVINTTNDAWGIITNTWNLGTRNFTMEFWSKFTVVPSTATGLVGARTDANNQWVMSIGGTGTLDMTFTLAGAVVGSYQTSSPWVADTNWHHLAFVRNGTAALIFVDGVSQPLTTTTAWGSATLGVLDAPLRFGQITGLSAYSGYIDEFRGSSSARYTVDFTPSTSAFGNSTLNTALVHFDGVNGSTNTVDISGNGGTKAVFMYGTALLSTAIKKIGTASIVLDGSGSVEIQDYWMNPVAVGLNADSTWHPAVKHLGDLSALALSYKITGLTNYLLSGRTATGLSVLSIDMIDSGYLSHDNFLGNTVDIIGPVYDWLYEVLDTTQKSNVVKVVDLFASYNLNDLFWFASDVTGDDFNRVYTNPETLYYSAAKLGNGHAWANMVYALQGLICTISETTNVYSKDFFEIAVSYMISQTYPYGGAASFYNVGLQYATAGTDRTVPVTMFLQSAFPAMHFEKNPLWATLTEWFERMSPVGMVEADAPWGDNGFGERLDWEGAGVKFLPIIVNSGTALQHYNLQTNLFPSRNRPDEPYNRFALYSGFTNVPTAQNITPNGNVFPVGGWAMGSSLPVNTHAAFTNGCGFIFCARPRGNDYQHDDPTDLSFQLWAYGSTITDSGGGMVSYPKTPMAHNTLLVNGLGTAQPEVQWTSNYSRITAFTNGSDFIYTAADATLAYPVFPFTVKGYWLQPAQYQLLHSTGALSNLVKVARHVLFVKGKYWVIYDELKHSTSATYSWLYHVYENTLTNGATPGTFHYTSNTQKVSGYNTNWPNIKVLVSHISTNVYMLDLVTTNVRSNPFTLENYYTQGDMAHIRAHAVWVQNAVVSTNFHFMTVIYPVKPGESDPTITRIDDFTARIQSGADDDTVTFNQYASATHSIMTDAPTSGATPEVAGHIRLRKSPISSARRR